MNTSLAMSVALGVRMRNSCLVKLLCCNREMVKHRKSDKPVTAFDWGAAQTQSFARCKFAIVSAAERRGHDRCQSAEYAVGVLKAAD